MISSLPSEPKQVHGTCRGLKHLASLLLLSVGATLVSLPATAGTLSGSGALTLPSNCATDGCGSGPIGVFPTVTNDGHGNFTGTWPHTVDFSYWGSFDGTGPYPAKNGTNDFDFAGIFGLSGKVLPQGTYIVFGDLDHGSGSEHFSLQAFDSSHNLISTPWLQDVLYVSGATPSEWVQGSMPEYNWSSHPGTYAFDGENVSGNPAVSVWLATNTNIAYLHVTSDTDFASFGMAAPAPEPGSLLLMGSGIVGLAGVIRRRFIG